MNNKSIVSIPSKGKTFTQYEVPTEVKIYIKQLEIYIRCPEASSILDVYEHLSPVKLEDTPMGGIKKKKHANNDSSTSQD